MSEGGKSAAAIAAAAAVALAAGCGGSGRLSESDYEQKLQAEGMRLQSAARPLCALQTATEGNLEALASGLGPARKKVENAADDIDSLKPPQDAKADNQTIADALHQIAKVFGEIKKAAESGNLQTTQALMEQAPPAAEAATHATNDLQKKGYDIGALDDPIPC
jgi:hypothetical protein